MRPDQLASGIRPLPVRILPEYKGEATVPVSELRELYKGTVEGFRRIIACAGSVVGATIGVYSSINLGEYVHNKHGRLVCRANLLKSEYDYANPTKSGFGVTTHFCGENSQGKQFLLDREEFGARVYPVAVRRLVPEFVANPDTDFPGVLMRLDPGWTPDSYQVVRSRLEPMIVEAKDTQALLLDALRDPALNPKFATAAHHLTIPGLPSTTS